MRGATTLDSGARDTAPLLVGAATADITPPFRCRLAGYPERVERWDRIHDRLEARAVVLRQGLVQLCVLSLDVMAFDESWARGLRTRARTELAIDPAGLMVAATHTHSAQGQLFAFDGAVGPALEALLADSEGPTDECLRRPLADAALACLRLALSRVQPATARAGMSAVEGIGSNRLHAGGPADPRCLFIAFETPTGDTIASLVHYACHPTVFGAADLGISADFPGAAVRTLEEQLGGVALFLNGALGDVSTRDSRRRHDPAQVERFGALLARFAEEARHVSEPFEPMLAAAIGRVLLPAKRSAWFEGVEGRVVGLRSQLDGLRAVGAPHGDLRRVETALEGAELAQRLRVPLRALPAVDVEIQLLQLSPGLRLVGVPAEVFAGLGLDLSKRLDGTTALVGPANGYLGYICTREAYAAGGYEADSSLVDPGAGETLVEAIADRLAESGMARGRAPVTGLRRLVAAADKPERLIVGIMSGSSLDGVDAALVRVGGCCEQTAWELVDFHYQPFEREAKERLFELFDYERAGVIEVTLMNAVLGEYIAEACRAVWEHANLRPEDVDALAVWPQMVFHQPGRMAPQHVLGFDLGACLQLGDLNTIAERTGVNVIGSFCQRDIAAGGNGSPLTGLGDYVVYHHPERNRVVQNIGGIGNANLVLAGGLVADVFGFDTGPGNMLIDAVVRDVTSGAQEFDADGVMAARGAPCAELVDETLQEPFIQREPPKAAGWEDFGTGFRDAFLARGTALGLSHDDLVATATAVTAESIALNHERWLQPRARVDEVICGGGGALNATLMRMLRERLAPIPVAVDEDYGVPSFAKEAIYMAFLANEAIMGHPNNVPSVTGASRAVVMGLIATAP